jgi:type IV pilus assembly protein PilE
LLISITIVAILSTIAYSNYTQHILRSRRADALSGLLSIQSYFEQQFTLQNAYPTSIPANLTTSLYYTYSLPSVTNTSFKATATPTAGGPQVSDTACPTLSIDSTGLQTAGSGSSSTQNNACWNR